MDKTQHTRTPDASKKLSLWLKLALASAALVGLPIVLYFGISNPSDPTATHGWTQPGTLPDDDVARIRKVEFQFWQALSDNLHPTFADNFDATVEALEVPIHSIEKNWPTGPTVVTYAGTAADAFKIHQALRSAGLPVSGYRAVE